MKQWHCDERNGPDIKLGIKPNWVTILRSWNITVSRTHTGKLMMSAAKIDLIDPKEVYNLRQLRRDCETIDSIIDEPH